MVVKMLKLAAVMLKEQQVAPGSQQEKELVEVLDRIHYDGGLEVRMAVIAIWGDHSELFRSRICASMVHHTQTIRLAAIRACTPLEQFARELEITFTVGTLSDRRAVVEMWSKDPTTFSANLRVAANDPMLVEEVVAIWAQSPGYFSASLRSVYLEGSLKARLAVVGAWAQSPLDVREDLILAATDKDEKVRTAVHTIWYSQPEDFSREIRDMLKLRRP
jgi:hypothetical protein